VRESFLAGERAACLLDGTPTGWLAPAFTDFEGFVFEGFVAQRRGVQIRWDVPSTTFWYVSGQHYLGTLIVRHRLTPQLAEIGGHIGYHVVPPWRRQTCHPDARCRTDGVPATRHRPRPDYLRSPSHCAG
jgi:hypothetical protein